MRRHINLLAAACLLTLAGCSTSPTSKALIERDPVDGLIAQNAAMVTQALRELSEASGHSRVVSKLSNGNSSPQPATAPVRPADTHKPLAPAFEPRPPANSIAARRGSIAVEVDAPVVTAIPSSSGVVASGGLLSKPPAGLEHLITVRWTGELEELLARVATETGWKLGEHAGMRVAPVIISISAESRSAFDVLRDIGGIAGTSADILVSASTKTISVRYPQR